MDGFKDVSAIIVTLAIIDPASQVLVNDYAQLMRANVFGDAADNTDTGTTWQTTLNQTSFAHDHQLVPAAAKAIRLYQRSFYLNSPL